VKTNEEIAPEDREALIQLHETKDEYDDGDWFAPPWNLTSVLLVLVVIAGLIALARQPQ